MAVFENIARQLYRLLQGLVWKENDFVACPCFFIILGDESIKRPCGFYSLAKHLNVPIIMNKKLVFNCCSVLNYRLFIFTFLFLFACVALPLAEASAKDLYVKPSAEVALRRGQGTEYKIVSMVRDGTKVELVEENESYTRVRLDSGLEGWMLTRFLTPEPPLSLVVVNLRSDKEKLEENSAEAAERIKELTLALASAREELETLRNERAHLSEEYSNLQKDTANVVQIKNDLERTMAEKEALQDKLTVVEEQYNTIKKDSTMYWFLAGAGVLILGILFGKMPGPSRKRKSSLL
ncbi:TIGR04211 family SH3 domain-containing protein [Desulforhopalus sp. IMCC35007]|uniref:TIGR04211 family SH3 domain-containing protein n=1 Tax=Desulforhopalus sp. IMCC35007 TaxID=2569543 RepID=UPI00145D8A41|nr:TIGR04211 family SH3 domain-containing protein [Desulforhopalus sp. IMCC35007]